MTTLVETPARYVRLGPKAIVQVGQLAATDTPHRHIEDAGSGSSCMACFGWRDDPRHLVRVPRVRKKKD